MRVLLLHPSDRLSSAYPFGKWDLIVDFGRAPATTYAEAIQARGIPIVSIFDFAKGIPDLAELRERISSGFGEVVDKFGIDWWSVLSVSIAPDLINIILLRRVAARISLDSELVTSKVDSKVRLLQCMVQGRLVTIPSPTGSVFSRLNYYPDRMRKLDRAKFFQVISDKFDREHQWRRRFSSRAPRGGPLVLLPSAYVNVSRTEVGYAELLPETRFLLVAARSVARLSKVPPNVTQISLDGYFGSVSGGEEKNLLSAWNRLRFHLAEKLGFSETECDEVFNRISPLLRWGLAVRSAWNALFDSHEITTCLSADDSNPYTRLPLMLAKNRGIPALACHHGALDSWMAFKNHHEDMYLAKSEMEKDYLTRKCGMEPERVYIGGPPEPRATEVGGDERRTWLVWFTEPYSSLGWRAEEVYRDLLPHLVRLAKECNLELVVKVHAFETAKGARRLLKQQIGSEADAIRVIEGPIQPELWRHAHLAVTGESSVAVESTRMGVPIFLCGWLRDPFAGYMEQFARYGAGRILNSSREIENIPHLLKSQVASDRSLNGLYQPMLAEDCKELLTGNFVRSAAISR